VSRHSIRTALAPEYIRSRFTLGKILDDLLFVIPTEIAKQKSRGRKGYSRRVHLTPNARVGQRAAALTPIESSLSITSTSCCPPLGYSPRDCSNALLQCAVMPRFRIRWQSVTELYPRDIVLQPGVMSRWIGSGIIEAAGRDVDVLLFGLVNVRDMCTAP
jgi:hypothetical protein